MVSQSVFCLASLTKMLSVLLSAINKPLWNNSAINKPFQSRHGTQCLIQSESSSPTAQLTCLQSVTKFGIVRLPCVLAHQPMLHLLPLYLLQHLFLFPCPSILSSRANSLSRCPSSQPLLPDHLCQGPHAQRQGQERPYDERPGPARLVSSLTRVPRPRQWLIVALTSELALLFLSYFALPLPPSLGATLCLGYELHEGKVGSWQTSYIQHHHRGGKNHCLLN